MATTIAREQRQAAKRHIIAQIEQGASVQQARAALDYTGPKNLNTEGGRNKRYSKHDEKTV